MNTTNSNVSNLSSLVLKWKRWHWYLLIIFNASIPLLLTINQILVAKFNQPETAKHLVLLALFPPLIMTLLILYMRTALKEYRECKVIIKPDRLKHFWTGVNASVISFILLIVALVVSYKVTSSNELASKIVVYTFLAFTCILGTVSGVFVTIYEFCVNFDLFYNKNKEAIIKGALIKEGLKIEEDKTDEN